MPLTSSPCELVTPEQAFGGWDKVAHSTSLPGGILDTALLKAPLRIELKHARYGILPAPFDAEMDSMADDASFRPIIYVRGYAMSRNEIDDTTADPFCGFNIGSTVLRATPDPKQAPEKVHLRIAAGAAAVRLRLCGRVPERCGHPRPGLGRHHSRPARSSSTAITNLHRACWAMRRRPDIEQFAKGLSDLILRVRELVCAEPDNKLTPRRISAATWSRTRWAAWCAARSCRTRSSARDTARKCVDKYFTYATPHNGIDIAGVNVPEWLGANDINNFNRERMSEYLDLEALYKKTKRVDWLQEETFPSSRVFCMVGTNRGDYGAAAGVSRTFAGHGSDGLVRIGNASVWGVNARGQTSVPSATAYTYRSHSGHFGIVNSEEAYQNLVRFLFGDVRVDIWVDVEDVRVPQELEAADKKGTLNGLYQFEVLASPRGSRWSLSRRVSEEDSPACRSHADLRDPAKKTSRRMYLSTVFLANRFRVNQNRPTLAYSLMLGVRCRTTKWRSGSGRTGTTKGNTCSVTRWFSR